MKDLNKSLRYILEENRRATYKSWIFSENEPCNASKMAEAGFIFVGNKHEPDSVICFFCNKALDGWEAEDNPWDEHLKHAPKCKFALLQQPEDTLTVKEFLELKTEYILKLIKEHFDEKKEKVKSIFEVIEQKLEGFK